MSTIPSISLIPSGYKANKVYSVLPTDGAADLTFARTSSGTRVNSNNLIEEVATGVPRLDYSDGTCPSLNLQPQSTNLITYPLSFDNGYWGKTSVSVTGGQSAPSVDNPTSAFKLDTSSVTGQAYINRSVTVTATNNYTFSVLAKKGEVDFICLVGLNPLTQSYFDLDTGVALGNTATSSKIEDYGNGWYRCSTTFTADTTSKFCAVYLSSNGTSLDATSILNGDGVYIFAAQLEEQSFATSLMLPNTEGSTVTRVAETASKTGLASYINSTEGVLYAEISSLSNTVNSNYISISDGTYDNRISIMYSLGTNLIRAFLRVGGVSQVDFSFTVSDITAFHKVAFKFAQDDFSLWIDGVEISTDISGSTIASNTLDRIHFGEVSGTTNPFKGKCKDLRVYKTALSDAELVTLTTI